MERKPHVHIVNLIASILVKKENPLKTINLYIVLIPKGNFRWFSLFYWRKSLFSRIYRKTSIASFILFEKENPLATISLPGKLLPASVSQYLSGNEEALLPKKT